MGTKREREGGGVLTMKFSAQALASAASFAFPDSAGLEGVDAWKC